MFLSLCHPYVSQSRWRLVFLTPEKYSNSHSSVKDWIYIRYRIEWKNLLSSCKLLRNESYVNVEDSFIHVFFFVWLLVPRTRAGFRKKPKSFKRFQFRQAVVQQSRRENIVAYLLLWSAIQRLAGARSRLYHVRLLLSKQHVSAFFKMYRLRVLPRGSLSCSLLVCHSAFLAFLLACLFCFFPSVSISVPFVFCSVFLVVPAIFPLYIGTII